MVKAILGNNKNIQTTAMKHGISMEPHASDNYIQHKQFRTTKAGLMLYQPHPYIAASPDLLVHCKCHGLGLCEIICPYKNRHLIPTADSVHYLENVNGVCQLKRVHEYFYQIHGQMGVASRRYCDFFVYTAHGYHWERILFDDVLWKSIVEKCTTFW